MTVPETTGRVAEAGGGASRLHRLIGPGVGVLAGVAIILLTQIIREPAIDTSFSPRWWPQILGGVVALLSLGVAIKDLVAPGADDEEIQPPTRTGAFRVLFVFVAVAGYGVLWYFIAFPVATFVLFVALAWILGARGWKSLVAFPLICTLVLYVLFGLLLKVPL
jgi:Tripartite tricarboxylate transporter TctB family